jgi:hypothetical protein
MIALAVAAAFVVGWGFATWQRKRAMDALAKHADRAQPVPLAYAGRSFYLIPAEPFHAVMMQASMYQQTQARQEAFAQEGA